MITKKEIKEPTVDVFMDVGFLKETYTVPLSKLFKDGFYSPRYYGYRMGDTNYYFGKRLSFFDIPDTEENRVLRANMRNNNWTHVVITRCGNIQPLEEGDVVIPVKESYIGQIIHKRLHNGEGEYPLMEDCDI